MALSSPGVGAQFGGSEYEQTEWPPSQFGQWSGPWDFKEEMTRETPQSPIYLPMVTEITHAGVLPPASPAQPSGGHAGKVILINDRLPTEAAPGWGNDQPTFVWDWRQPSDLATLWVSNTTSRDLFCSGHTFLADGGFFVTGGLNRDLAFGGTQPVGHGGTFVLRTVSGNLVWEPHLDGQKRWYPTVVSEPDGVRVAGHFGWPPGVGTRWDRWLPSMAVPASVTGWEGSGEHYREKADDGPVVEIHCPTNGSPFIMDLSDYPRLFLLATGDLMWVDGRHLAGVPLDLFHKSWFLNINPQHPKDCPDDPMNPWHWREGTHTLDTEATRHAGSNAVLLLTRHPQPGFDKWIETVYVMGGTERGEDDKPCPCEAAGVTNVMRRIQRDTEASNDPLEIGYQPWFQQAWETSSTNPLASGAGPKAMRRKRVNGNTAILPNGELLAIGGTRMDDGPDPPSPPGCAGTEAPVDPNLQSVPNPSAVGCLHNRAAELYRPNEVFGTPTSEQPPWKLMPAQQHRRQYHSVAFLLPDGSVGSAGGTYFKPGVEDHRYSVEIYKPWYFFAGMRPVIEVPPQSDGLPLQRTQAYMMEVRTRVGMTIDRLTLVRNASVTHAFDSNQRYIELHLTEPPALKAGTSDVWEVTFQVPFNPYAAPSGWYMLTAVDNAHRPSESIWVQI